MAAKRKKFTPEMYKAAVAMLVNSDKNHHQVAKALGVSYTTIYYHVGSKRELLAEKAKQLADRAAKMKGRKPDRIRSDPGRKNVNARKAA